MDARRGFNASGGESAAPPAIEVAFPDLGRWAAGNARIPYAWTFAAERPGPHVLVQALTHGNEVCGAIALDWLLDSGLRPLRGTLTLCFANVAAYRTFDPAEPFSSRCVDEDFNRLWAPDVLDSSRTSVDLDRARQLRPLYDTVDYLLDLHSMTDPCPPLSMAGRQRKGVVLAQALGTPAHIIVDGGHAAGRRLRDYAFFDDPDDPRNALLIECGQHWEGASADVARQATLLFLRQFGMADPAFLDRHLESLPDARAEGDRGDRRGHHCHRHIRFRDPRARPFRCREGGNAAGARRRRRDPHAVRRLRAHHADTAATQGRDCRAPRPFRQLRSPAAPRAALP